MISPALFLYRKESWQFSRKMSTPLLRFGLPTPSNADSEKSEGGPAPWDISVTIPAWTESCFLPCFLRSSAAGERKHFLFAEFPTKLGLS